MTSIQQIRINYDQRLSLECCTACTCQPMQSQKAILWQGPTLFTVVTSAGTIDGACLSYVFPSAARIPGACFGVALMAVVQALSCVLWKHHQSESHQLSTQGASNDHCSTKIKCDADTSPIGLHHPNPPVLPADLGGLMNGHA